MEHKHSRNKGFWLAKASACAAIIAFAAGVAQAKPAKSKTVTPIEHVIVIVGENHTFDNTFGGYVPSKGQTVWNLLSEKIINPDGSAGTNFGNAAQLQASDTVTYSPTPTLGAPYSPLPTPDTTYAFGQPGNVPDPRWASTTLLDGPFQFTKHGSTPGAAYFGGFTGDPVHRFFQMWQDYDGGRLDLFTWVGQTIGTGSNGIPVPFNTHQGGVAMGFDNMSVGDVPFFKYLADH
jgi:phospholipase C